jgi:glucuronoarabinoxylan endo-1,4-beta-xylanase
LIKASIILSLICIISSALFAQSATVNWVTTYQTMDGFGGQTWVYADSLKSSQADLFFSPSAGIGLQYVRTANTYNSSIPDLTTLQEAGARGALIELGIQSPPCTLKHSYVDLGEACTDPSPQTGAFSNGTTGTSGTCFANGTLPGAYSVYATYLVNYINTLSAGVGYPISVIDVQNEPGITTGGLGTCAFTASAFDTFIGTYLGPAFASASWNSTQKASPKIMLSSYETWFSPDLVSTCLNDSTCAQYVSIVAGHGYKYPITGGGVPSSVRSWYNTSPTTHHIWVSETGTQNWACDTGMTSGAGAGMTWAEMIHNTLTNANVSALEWWELAYAAAGCNYGLTDDSFNPTKRYYIEGQWSKFIGTGWLRIDATANPVDGVDITAFKETTSGNFAIVAVNQNSAPVTVFFSLAGFPSATSVTPTLTSAGSDLEDQASVNISDASFSYSLPGTSVTTFHGTASSSTASKAPAAPKNLAATVN